MRCFHISIIWKITSTHWSGTRQYSLWCGEENREKRGKNLRYCCGWGQNSCSKSNPCTLLNPILHLFSVRVRGCFMVSSKGWGSGHNWLFLLFPIVAVSIFTVKTPNRPRDLISWLSTLHFCKHGLTLCWKVPFRELHISLYLSMTTLLGYH